MKLIFEASERTEYLSLCNLHAFLFVCDHEPKEGRETQFYFGKSIVNLINGGSFYKSTNDEEFLKAQPMAGYFLVCCLVRILGTKSGWRKFLLSSWASSLVRRQPGITETFAPFLLLLDTLALNLH